MCLYAFIYFIFALIFSAAMILVLFLFSYGVYGLWPIKWWPKKRNSGWENPVFLRGTHLEVDRITDYLIHKQEVATAIVQKNSLCRAKYFCIELKITLYAVSRLR